jgi:hypothetical protein
MTQMRWREAGFDEESFSHVRTSDSRQTKLWVLQAKEEGGEWVDVPKSEMVVEGGDSPPVAPEPAQPEEISSDPPSETSQTSDPDPQP